MRGHKGFTLIELLIVVAIIAILAAIAIPNFLAAQTRSKVSRAKGEQNMLATGLESYFIDANVYPSPASGLGYATESRDGTAGYTSTQDGGLIPVTMTTPIAYITAIPKDPFKKNQRGFYEYGGGPGLTGGAGTATNTSPAAGPRDHSGIWPPAGWIVTSYGPDVVDGNIGSGGSGLTNNIALREESCWTDSYADCQVTVSNPLQTSGLTYDPTNGTTSAGDVWRRGP